MEVTEVNYVTDSGKVHRGLRISGIAGTFVLEMCNLDDARDEKEYPDLDSAVAAAKARSSVGMIVYCGHCKPYQEA